MQMCAMKKSSLFSSNGDSPEHECIGKEQHSICEVEESDVPSSRRPCSSISSTASAAPNFSPEAFKSSKRTLNLDSSEIPT